MEAARKIRLCFHDPAGYRDYDEPTGLGDICKYTGILGVRNICENLQNTNTILSKVTVWALLRRAGSSECSEAQIATIFNSVDISAATKIRVMSRYRAKHYYIDSDGPDDFELRMIVNSRIGVDDIDEIMSLSKSAYRLIFAHAARVDKPAYDRLCAMGVKLSAHLNHLHGDGTAKINTLYHNIHTRLPSLDDHPERHDMLSGFTLLMYAQCSITRWSTIERIHSRIGNPNELPHHRFRSTFGYEEDAHHIACDLHTGLIIAHFVNNPMATEREFLAMYRSNLGRQIDDHIPALSRVPFNIFSRLSQDAAKYLETMCGVKFVSSAVMTGDCPNTAGNIRVAWSTHENALINNAYYIISRDWHYRWLYNWKADQYNACAVVTAITHYYNRAIGEMSNDIAMRLYERLRVPGAYEYHLQMMNVVDTVVREPVVVIAPMMTWVDIPVAIREHKQAIRAHPERRERAYTQ